MTKEIKKQLKEEFKKLERMETDLEMFIYSSDIFKSLPENEQQMMEGQHAAMLSYGTFLQLRIGLKNGRTKK